jgi:ABC-type multidrug transport system ATPase subunit
MQLVNRVCKASDMAAVVVIHQPNGYIFETFDRLILLSSGNCIFSDYASKLEGLYENEFGESMPSDKHELPLDIMRKLKDLDAKEFVASPTQIDESENHDATNSSRNDFAFSDHQTPRVSFHWTLGVVFHRNLTNHHVRNFTNLAPVFSSTHCARCWTVLCFGKPKSV